MNNPILDKKLQDKEFLIACHRGFFGGNIIQNTVESAKAALKANTDIIEIDICKSKDGKYYIFHDGNEKLLFNTEKSFFELTSDELENMEFYNSLSSPSGKYIDSFEKFLEWIPEGVLINIDRSWEYWSDQEFINLVDYSGKTEQLLFKSKVDERYIESLRNFKNKLYYFPIIYSQDEFERVLGYDHFYLIGSELIIPNEECDLFNLSSDSKILQYPLRMINSETLGIGFNLFLDVSDEDAIIDGEEKVWGKMLEMGATCIQTDWPNFLNDYRTKLDETIG